MTRIYSNNCILLVGQIQEVVRIAVKWVLGLALFLVFAYGNNAEAQEKFYRFEAEFGFAKKKTRGLYYSQPSEYPLPPYQLSLAAHRVYKPKDFAMSFSIGANLKCRLSNLVNSFHISMPLGMAHFRSDAKRVTVSFGFEPAITIGNRFKHGDEWLGIPLMTFGGFFKIGKSFPLKSLGKFLAVQVGFTQDITTYYRFKTYGLRANRFVENVHPFQISLSFSRINKVT